MKKYIALSLLCFASITFAQEGKYKKADKAFENMAYLEAARLYETAIEDKDNPQELLQNAGDANYYNNNMLEASRWYDKLFNEYKNEEIESRYAFRFIQALQSSKQIEKSVIAMKFFQDSQILNPIQVEQLKKGGLDQVEAVFSMPISFQIKKLSINGDFADFAPMFYGDKVVFASARDTMDLHTREYHWNEQPYLDLYTANRNDKNLELRAVRSFSNVINTKYHEAGVSFSPDNNTLYFTRNNFIEDLERDSEGVNHLKLYKAKRTSNPDRSDKKSQDSIWSEVEELPFNNLNYSVGHPAVTPDGKMLYFVSDMPGGMGETDIYKVSINDDGTYGTPTNLGPTVNTDGREMFPFVTENKLYFASDGHAGLGGLDVFESLFLDGNVTDPVNLAAPLNSTKDDFSFIIDAEDTSGYFASNRNGGKGDDDIYAFTRNKVEVVEVIEACTQVANGTVINKLSKIAIPNADVVLKDANGTQLESIKTDANGAFVFSTPLDCETAYTVIASKPKYGSATKSFTTSTELGLELGLALETDPIIDLIYDDNGVKKFRIDNLNFDLNKDNIRPDAAAELDKIVAVMTEYQSIVIKIESHTDSRGSDAYNENLSDRRAKSTRDYLISRGIATNRIESAIGYGEKRLLNECSNGTRCSNEKHDVNRRSEFIITRM